LETEGGSIVNFLKKIVAFFVGLFSKKTADAILAGIRQAAPYVSSALQLAATVAGVVGGPAGRTVATVVQAAGRLGVDALIARDATDAQLGTALRDIVVAALKKEFPNASTADLNRAVELAVGALKGGL
jgi:hypothetical protein